MGMYSCWTATESVFSTFYSQTFDVFNAQNRIQTGKYRGKEWRKWDQEMAQATLKLVSPTREPRVTNMPLFATAAFP